MAELILYGIDASPPFRCVLLTLSALALDYEFRQVNLMAGEHKSDEFLKKNPQHTVPVLEDGGQALWDSHAISAYLVRKYANNDSLYPKDFYQRAVVDQRLHFDSGILFPSLNAITAPLFFMNATSVPQEKIDALYDAYNFMELFLQHDFIAGNNLTIADFSLISTLSSTQAVAPVDAAKTPKLAVWMNSLAKLPYYEKANAKGAAMSTGMIKSKIVQN